MLEQFNQIKDLKLKVKTALDLAQAVAHLNGDERVQQAIDAGRLVLAQPTEENRRNAVDADAGYVVDAAVAAVAAAAAVDAVDAAYAAAVAVDAAVYAASYAVDAAGYAVDAAGYAVDADAGYVVDADAGYVVAAAGYVVAAAVDAAGYAAAKGDKELTNKLGSIIQTALIKQLEQYPEHSEVGE